MTEQIPIETVKGVEEVTAWLWPNGPDPVTVRFSYREWARIERHAEREGISVEELLVRAVFEDRDGVTG